MDDHHHHHQFQSDSLSELLNPTAASSAGDRERSFFDKDGVLPSYDFQLGGSTKKSTRAIPGAQPSQGYPLAEPSWMSELVKSKCDTELYDSVTVAAVERTMKKYAHNILSVLEGMNGRFLQLESTTRRLELSIDGLRAIGVDNHNEIDGRLKKVENLIKEVQMGVQVLHDKQEKLEEQSNTLNSQLLKTPLKTLASDELQVATAATPAVAQHMHQLAPSTISQTPQLLPQQSPQIMPPSQLQQPPMALPSQLLPQQSPQLPTPPQQSLESSVSTSIPNEPHHFPGQHVLPPSAPVQQYPAAPHHLQQQQGPSHSTQMPMFYSQNIESHEVPQVAYGQQTETPPYFAPTTRSGNYVPEFSVSATGNYNATPPRHLTPSQQAVPPSLPQHGLGGSYTYDSSLMRTASNTGSPRAFLPQADPVPYETQTGGYGTALKMARPLMSASSAGVGGYPRLPTAQPIRHALPTSAANAGGAPLSTTRVPVDEIIDKVSAMGFTRDQVRGVVHRLTENGQSVDLNIVLDKLMNGGEVQPQRGWFGR